MLTAVPKLSAPFIDLVNRIAISSQTKRVPLEDVERMFYAKIAEVARSIEAEKEAASDTDAEVDPTAVVEVAADLAEAAAPDLPDFLEALAKAGVDIDDGTDDLEIETSGEKLGALLASAGIAGDLDAFSQWQREAAHHPLLDRAQEAELTHRYALYAQTAASLRQSSERLVRKLDTLEERVRAGREVIEMLESDPDGLDAASIDTARAAVATDTTSIAELRDEVDRLDDEIASAERSARAVEEQFISFNFRLVLHQARKKHEKANRRGDFMDLVQQGNLGMLDAFRKFDPSRGFKFSTFATWYINQKISEWLYEQIGVIRVPVHRWRDARSISKFKHEHFEATGEAPTLEEVAKAIGRTPKKVGEIMRADALTKTDTLDRPATQEEGSALLGELVADVNALDPETEIMRATLKAALDGAFARVLDARERRVLILRFGLYDGEPKTLDWIGKRMKITRERVRQIEAKAFSKLEKDPEIRSMSSGGRRRERSVA